MILNYLTVCIIIAISWLAGLIFLYLPLKPGARKLSDIFLIAGLAILLLYIINLWIDLGRPPLRTLGETRLWYAFFLSSIGLILFYLRKLKLVPLISMPIAFIFLSVNLIILKTLKRILCLHFSVIGTCLK